MRHLTSTIAAFTLASAVGVLAHDQAPAPPAAKEQAPAEQAAPKEQAPSEQAAPAPSTLTGCVVQAKTTDGGTVYVLSKAEGGSAQMYVLGGKNESDFSANVNKKVEVTGPVLEPPGTDNGKPADPKVVRPPAIVAQSVKVVAESCT